MPHLYKPWERNRRSREAADGSRKPSPRDELDRGVVNTRNMILGTLPHRSWGPSYSMPGPAGLVVPLVVLLLKGAWFVLRIPLRLLGLRRPRFRRTWEQRGHDRH